jgi:hypothetical protein
MSGFVISSETLDRTNRMMGRLGSRWDFTPRRCAAHRADYDDMPRRNPPSRNVSSDDGDGAGDAETHDAGEVVFCCRLLGLRKAHPYGGGASTKPEA